MRFVPIKTDDQLDRQALHRVRDRLIARRTSVINQLRSFLLERGMTFSKTLAKLKLAMPEILENADASRATSPLSQGPRANPCERPLGLG
jgi:transposase